MRKPRRSKLRVRKSINLRRGMEWAEGAIRRSENKPNLPSPADKVQEDELTDVSQAMIWRLGQELGIETYRKGRLLSWLHGKSWHTVQIVGDQICVNGRILGLGDPNLLDMLKLALATAPSQDELEKQLCFVNPRLAAMAQRRANQKAQ